MTALLHSHTQRYVGVSTEHLKTVDVMLDNEKPSLLYVGVWIGSCPNDAMPGHMSYTAINHFEAQSEGSASPELMY